MTLVRQHNKNEQVSRDKIQRETPVVYVRYEDHVLYHRTNPAIMKPQIREATGWLVHECADYIIICWDRDAGPPSLRVGDPKASGLVVLRSDILEMKRIRESNSEIKPLFSKTEQPNMRENT